MSIWKCSQSCSTSEGRCRPKSCPNCGSSKEQIVKAE